MPLALVVSCVQRTDTARGVLLGLACGDALGRPVEFQSASQIAAEYGRLTEMEGDGTWNKPPGTVTDDTDLALCIARSTVEQDGFDPSDVADRFVDWYEGRPFDIGIMTRKSIRRYREGDAWNEAGQRVWEASAEGANAGNGSVMRCAPLALAYADDRDRLAEVSRKSSRITHADPRCAAGCAVLNLTLAGLIEGQPAPLADAMATVENVPAELRTALEPIVDGSEPTLETSGYVVHTLTTALYDALNADDIEEAIVTTVNRGGDTDTIGAVVGAVAGARFGASDLPDRWLDVLDHRSELEQLADELAAVQEGTS